eukprot:m.69322 g.69322  ORF g.69322 m.69322 type:complete len:269 (+) comp13975_c0_seq1:369-1175(+)
MPSTPTCLPGRPLTRASGSRSWTRNSSALLRSSDAGLDLRGDGCSEAHCLIEPVTWLSEMCALLIHPLQAKPSCVEDRVPVPTLTVRDVRGVLDGAEQTRNKFDDDQAHRLLKLLQAMDICFEYKAQGFVFPSLLPPCQANELVVPCDDAALCVAFGRRFVLTSETDSLPPALFAVLTKALCHGMDVHALRQNVLQVRVFGTCFVTVCFNAGAGVAGRSQPHACVSFDVAVAAAWSPAQGGAAQVENAVQALHTITCELRGAFFAAET